MTKLPQVSHERAVRALKRTGFYVLREGKHISMTDDKHLVIIPRHQARHIEADSGSSRDFSRLVQRLALKNAPSRESGRFHTETGIRILMCPEPVEGLRMNG